MSNFVLTLKILCGILTKLIRETHWCGELQAAGKENSITVHSVNGKGLVRETGTYSQKIKNSLTEKIICGILSELL